MLKTQNSVAWLISVPKQQIPQLSSAAENCGPYTSLNVYQSDIVITAV